MLQMAAFDDIQSPGKYKLHKDYENINTNRYQQKWLQYFRIYLPINRKKK